MKSKLIELTDGSKLEVKVNFYTLYLVKMNGIDKKLDGRDDLTEEENMELAGKMIYVILRSNGLKVDEEEAMMLTPMDTKSIQDIFNEFEKRLKEYKKKRTGEEVGCSKEKVDINWAEYMVCARKMGMSEEEFWNSDPVFFNECLEIFSEMERQKGGALHG